MIRRAVEGVLHQEVVGGVGVHAGIGYFDALLKELDEDGQIVPALAQAAKRARRVAASG